MNDREGRGPNMHRPDLLGAGLGLAVASVLPRSGPGALADGQAALASASSRAVQLARRRLGNLEVSALGLGCMGGSAFNLPFPGKRRMISVII